MSGSESNTKKKFWTLQKILLLCEIKMIVVSVFFFKKENIIYIEAGFILRMVYGACCPVYPLDEKFLAHCLMILIKLPDIQKCIPAKN